MGDWGFFADVVDEFRGCRIDVDNRAAEHDGDAVHLLLGESNCSGASGFCLVRILVDGTDVQESLVIFDNTELGVQDLGTVEAHAVVRSVANIAAGTTVTIQRNVSAGAITFVLDGWGLQVQALKE